MISALARKRILGMAKKFLTDKYIKLEHIYGIDGGSYKSYKKLTESWGVKFSTQEKTIVDNFKLQRKAWRASVGPFCFGMGKLAIGKDYEGDTLYMYYYITENAAVLYCAGISDNSNYLRKLNLNYRKYSKMIHRFFKKYTQQYWGDEADRNVGILRNRLVCIDFDKI